MKLPFEMASKKVMVRKDSVTDPNYGSKPEERKVEDMIDYGAVNIDKPAGPTSHQVSDYVQKILHISKAGHSGTLE